MSLYLEIGNTTAKLARRGVSAWKVDILENLEQVMERLREERKEVIAVAAPSRQEWLDALKSVCTVRQITRRPLRDFIGDNYDTPETLGIDRVLNLLGLAADGVVISCGTAITVDALVKGKPRFGAIMPGLRTAAEGLHNRIPTLPLIEPHEPYIKTLSKRGVRFANWPDDRTVQFPSRTSRDSVWNGVVMGTVWGAAALAGELWRECGQKSAAPISITGGDAMIVSLNWPITPTPTSDPHLLFRGMERAAPWL